MTINIDPTTANTDGNDLSASTDISACQKAQVTPEADNNTGQVSKLNFLRVLTGRNTRREIERRTPFV